MLRDRLLQAGAEVRCLVRSGKTGVDDTGAIRYRIDYSDTNSLISSGALNDADYLYHVAGVTKSLTLDGFRKGNVMPTQHLVDALTELKTPLQRFVLISSQAAAGPASSDARPKTEADEPAPVEDYGLSKLEAENVLRKASLDFPYTIIRPAAVYGPRDVDFLALFKQLKNGLGIYPGNRNAYVSTIFVTDLVEGILKAATNKVGSNQTYFMTREIALTWEEIYRMIAEIWGSRLKELNLPFGLVAMAGQLGDLYAKATGRITVMNSKKIDLARPKYWVCSSEKAQRELQFVPSTQIEQGLQQTFEWYKEAGWL